MKKLEPVLLFAIVLFLSIHLFTIHSKLLFHLNPDKVVEYLEYRFSIDLFNQSMIVSTLSAIAYSFITAFILFIFVKYRKVFLLSVISFAILDGVGVFIYYNASIQDDNFVIFGSIYYSLYTLFIVLSVGLYRNMNYSEHEYITGPDNNIKNLSDAISESDVMNLRQEMQNIHMTSDQKFKKIKELDKQGFKQKEIADTLDISQSTVSRILNKL
jgi:predicted XRE-type DNA-binding protein